MELLHPDAIAELRKMIKGIYEDDEVWIKDISSSDGNVQRVAVNGDDDVLCRISTINTLNENSGSRQKPIIQPTGDPEKMYRNKLGFDVNTLRKHVHANTLREAETIKDNLPPCENFYVPPVKPTNKNGGRL